jgi:hypothetical protein
MNFMSISFYETKHDFCQIAKVHDNKNHASFKWQLKSKLLSYEMNE